MDTFLIISPGFPEDESDSTCLPPIQQFILSLKELYPQFKFIVISFQYPFTSGEYNWNGIKVIALGGKNKPKLFRLSIWIKAFRKMKQLHRETPLRGMLSLWVTECALVSSFFSKRHQIPHFIWMQGQDARKGNRYVSLIRPKDKQLIAISQFTKELFYRNYHQMPALVAENGIRTAIFPTFNSGTRRIDVLGVGSLTALKNYSLFVEVIAELKKKFPSINVAIAGSGPELENLRSQIEAAALGSNFSLLGSVSHQKVLQLMSESKVFLHTSSYEGNSTVLMEALYSGCKAVSTCALSYEEIKNLYIGNSKSELATFAQNILRENVTSEPVLFNTMAESTKKIMNLFY